MIVLIEVAAEVQRTTSISDVSPAKFEVEIGDL